MAESTDLQKLVIQLEASFTKYERAWQRAQGITDTNTDKLRKKFDRAGRDTAGGLRPVQVQTANISSQFQDIAVQLQSGTSPFTIALQQGTQLTAALGPGAGLRGALSGIAAGFGGLINPVSLATIAIITLGGTAVQWLASMTKGAEDADEVLENHVKRIKQIVSGYEGAEQAVDDYIKKQQQLPEAAAASELEADRERALQRYADEVNRVIAFQQKLADPLAAFAFGVSEEKSIETIDNLAISLEKLTADGELTKAELDGLVTLFTEMKNTSTDSGLRGLAEEALRLLDGVKGARTQVESLGVALNNLPSEIAIAIKLQTDSKNFADAIGQLRDLAPELRSAGEVARAAAQDALNKALGSAGSGIERAAALKEYEATIAAIAEQERRLAAERAQRAGQQGASEADRERQAVLDLIAALEFEQSIIGLSRAEQDALRASREAGAAATDAQRQRIEELVRANYYDQQQVEALQQAYQQLGEIGKSAIRGVIDALADGKIEGEEFLNVLGSIATQLGNLFINNAFNSLNGGGFDISKLFQFRANGGPVQAGRPYIVGEKRPEVFVPNTAGTILPKVPSGMGGAPVFTFHIDARGAQMGVAEEIERRLDHYSRQVLPGRVRAIQNDPYAVG